MSLSELMKVVVYVPESHADIVRKAMIEAGAGKFEKYTGCSFSVKGIGRFKPKKGASPTVGEIGKNEEVLEERIETVCRRSIIKDVIEAIKKVHPYEEIAYDVYPREEI
jgi:hypothetical protein